MTVHLIKLCVGIKNLDQLVSWQRQKSYKLDGKDVVEHITRNFPKRKDELLSGGSIYWIIGGCVVARNLIIALEEVTNEEGKKFCKLILQTPFTVTEPKQHRPFQGWRYFNADRAPKDVSSAQGHKSLPLEMMKELKELGLL